MASSEWPPSSKKLSWTPTTATPNTSAQIPTIRPGSRAPSRNPTTIANTFQRCRARRSGLPFDSRGTSVTTTTRPARKVVRQPGSREPVQVADVELFLHGANEGHRALRDNRFNHARILFQYHLDIVGALIAGAPPGSTGPSQTRRPSTDRRAHFARAVKTPSGRTAEVSTRDEASADTAVEPTAPTHRQSLHVYLARKANGGGMSITIQDPAVPSPGRIASCTSAAGAFNEFDLQARRVEHLPPAGSPPDVPRLLPLGRVQHSARTAGVA